MSKNQIYFLILILILISGFFVYYYVFNIYEVTYSVKPKNLYADYKSQVTINAVPLNALGFRAPLRHSKSNFSIVEGKDLVEIVDKNNEKGFLILRAKNKTGTVIVHVKSEFALLPSSVTINVYPNYASNIK